DQISKLQSDLKPLQEDNKQLHDTLNKVKTELETQKDQLVQKLQDVETKRKENKEEVQMVVKKITEKENSDDTDLLLKEKENLLHSQWKLDEEKKFYERQILNIEKVMEPMEMQMMRKMEKDEDVEKEAEDDQISKLQSDLKQLQEDNKPLHDTLNKVKTELETQKDQLVQKLQDVETKRKENKEEVQMVEKKITEIKNSDDTDLVLGEQENLLQSQWKLDEEKKLYERQILNIEKVMEPMEMQMMRKMEKDEDVEKEAEDGEGVQNDASLTNQDQTTCEKDQGSCLKWGLIGAAVGIVVGMVIGFSVFRICKWKKSNYSRHQDNEAGSGEQETIIPETETNQISKLQSDLKPLQEDNKQLHDTLNAVKHELETQKLQKDQLQSVNKLLDETLNKVKTELETQKDQLLQKLRDVETKRKENKEEVQMVVKKITEIKNSDDNELLLKEKENLLQSQWKLDEEKKHYERQILNIEKVMEPMEMQMMRAMEQDEDV
ncbi:PREDICTED: cytadherence high molecular weight protein 2-like, partial [Poecilia mexicana]|uniref:cytadherence high molecular weight protein 2-like n=1 Tax=Poecilia mexicana TaxID=48701 RepID=UPI00072EBCCF